MIISLRQALLEQKEHESDHINEALARHQAQNNELALTIQTMREKFEKTLLDTKQEAQSQLNSCLIENKQLQESIISLRDAIETHDLQADHQIQNQHLAAKKIISELEETIRQLRRDKDIPDGRQS